MAVSAQSASMRSTPGYAKPKQQPQINEAPALSLPAVPEAPSLAVQNPITAAQKGTILSQLNPNSPNYIGKKYQGAFTQLGGNLRTGLAGFGNYKFNDANGDGIFGSGELTKDTKGQPGSNYRQAYQDERAGANAQGMLYGRTADEAVSRAWHRLGQEERGILNQYSSEVSSLLGQWSSEHSGLISDLQGLYGEDIKYAMENPPPAPPDWVRPPIDVNSVDYGQPVQMHISQTSRPDEATLRQMYPGFDFDIQYKDLGGGRMGWVTYGRRSGSPPPPPGTPANQGGDTNYAQQNRERWHRELPKNFGQMSGGAASGYLNQIAADMGVPPAALQLTYRKDGTPIVAVKKEYR